MSTLQELFSRDPNKCTRDDVRAIIAAMREHATNYALKAAAPKKAKLSGKQETTVRTLGDQNVDI